MNAKNLATRGREENRKLQFESLSILTGMGDIDRLPSMLRRKLSACLALFSAALAGSAFAKNKSDLDRLYDQHRWFELRERCEHGEVPALYRGAVAAAFNQNQAAETMLDEVVKKNPDSDPALEAREILSKVYSREGRYKESVEELDEILSIAPKRADVRNVRTIFAAWSRYPDQSVPVDASTSIQADVRPDGVRLPVVIHGKTVHWLLDTGFNFSMMSESEARALGIVVDEASGNLYDSAGGQTTMKTAVVDELAIGNFRLRNVAFLIMPDKNEPMKDWKPDERGLLGLPIALAFRSFSWQSAGTFRIRPKHNMAGRKPNMCLDGLTPIVEVGFEGKKLDFGFDTGDQAGSQLWTRFSNEFRTLLMNEGAKSTKEVDQVGGPSLKSIIVLPQLTMEVGGLSTTLRPAEVFSKPVGDDFHHGLLGMDVLSQASEVSVDLGSMSLTLSR